MENLDRQHCASETPEVARTANECVRHILWTPWACQERADFTTILSFLVFPKIWSVLMHIWQMQSQCAGDTRSLVELVGRFQPHRTWWPWHSIYKSNRTYLVDWRNSLYKRLKHSQIHCFHIQWFFYTDIIRWEGLPKWKCSSQLPWTPRSCLISTVFHFSTGKVELISVFLSLSLHIWIVFLRAGTMLFCDTSIYPLSTALYNCKALCLYNLKRKSPLLVTSCLSLCCFQTLTKHSFEFIGTGKKNSINKSLFTRPLSLLVLVSNLMSLSKTYITQEAFH